MNDRDEFDAGSLFWLLITAAAFSFFVYMTSGHGSALSVPLYL